MDDEKGGFEDRNIFNWHDLKWFGSIILLGAGMYYAEKQDVAILTYRLDSVQGVQGTFVTKQAQEDEYKYIQLQLEQLNSKMDDLKKAVR